MRPTDLAIRKDRLRAPSGATQRPEAVGQRTTWMSDCAALGRVAPPLLLLLLLTAAGSPGARAASGVELILGKARPPTPTPTPAPAADPSAVAEVGDAGNAQGDGNSSKPALTGVPQLDYVHDPNLPRELNGYNLSAYPFYDRVPEDMMFSCDGLHDGFYASVPHKCQVYHHCLFGTRYDFLCANYTAFDQKTFICHFVSEVDCENSPKYFNRNEALYKAATTTTVAPPHAAGGRRGGGNGGGGGGGRRRRPAGGAGGGARRPYYDYEYEDAYYDEYDEDQRGGGGGRQRPQGGKEAPLPAAPPRAVFERPRVAPKVRRPVPLSERDKYEYTGAAPAPAPVAAPAAAPDAPPALEPDRERGKGEDSGGSGGASSHKEEQTYARHPEVAPAPRERDRPDTYSRRPQDAAFGRHRERDRSDTSRPDAHRSTGHSHSHGRDRPHDRRPYRRRPSVEEDDDYYYYDDGEDEEDYRPRRPAARPRVRPRPRRPPPRYRDDYEEEEYDDEEEDVYGRPVPASRPAYVTAAGSGGRRARPRLPAPRRPNRHSTRYTEPEDDYYYDEDDEPVEVARPLSAQRRRGRPTTPGSARRRYPEDDLEDDPSGPVASAISSRHPPPLPLPLPAKSPSKSPATTKSPPPTSTKAALSGQVNGGLRSKLVEIRRHHMRSPVPPTAPVFATPSDPDASSADAEELELPRPRGRFEARSPTRTDGDADSDADSDGRRHNTQAPAKALARLPDDDAKLDAHFAKFPSRGEQDARPAKLPSRTLASEAQTPDAREGHPAEEAPRQRSEPRAAGKIFARPVMPPHDQDKGGRPAVGAEVAGGGDGPSSASERISFAGKFLSRAGPSAADGAVKHSGRGELTKVRPPLQTKPLQPLARVPDVPKFVPKASGRRGNFGRPDRLNLAEMEDDLGEENAEGNKDVEDDEDDETINDALHPRPLRADGASVAGLPPASAAPQPPSGPALGPLLRLTPAPTTLRRLATHAPPTPQPRVRSAPEPSGLRQFLPMYNAYYAY